MTQYKANVGSAAMSGTLTWNANWTLGSQVISDALNSADAQTCTYGYDGLARLSSGRLRIRLEPDLQLRSFRQYHQVRFPVVRSDVQRHHKSIYGHRDGHAHL